VACARRGRTLTSASIPSTPSPMRSSSRTCTSTSGIAKTRSFGPQPPSPGTNTSVARSSPKVNSPGGDLRGRMAMAAAHFNGATGLRGQQDLTVLPAHTAAYASGGLLPEVLSTPHLLQLVEDATSSLAARHLDDGYVSVGFQVV